MSIESKHSRKLKLSATKIIKNNEKRNSVLAKVEEIRALNLVSRHFEINNKNLTARALSLHHYGYQSELVDLWCDKLETKISEVLA